MHRFPFALFSLCTHAPFSRAPMQVAIDKLESKLRSLNMGTYTMSEFIRHKESETNYKVGSGYFLEPYSYLSQAELGAFSVTS